jgi:hypothetical protein
MAMINDTRQSRVGRAVSGQWRAMADGIDGIHGIYGNVVSKGAGRLSVLAGPNLPPIHTVSR